MATGKPQAQIHKVFAKRIADLKNKHSLNFAAFRDNGQRQWLMPDGMQTSVLDVPAIHTPAFDRSDINTNYETATNDPDTAGTNGDVMSLKLQMDYVAAEERAFRLRHASPVRALTVAMGRSEGLGDGQVFTRVREEAEKLIATGGV